jgi:hypothetical protein
MKETNIFIETAQEYKDRYQERLKRYIDELDGTEELFIIDQINELSMVEFVIRTLDIWDPQWDNLLVSTLRSNDPTRIRNSAISKRAFLESMAASLQPEPGKRVAPPDDPDMKTKGAFCFLLYNDDHIQGDETKSAFCKRICKLFKWRYTSTVSQNMKSPDENEKKKIVSLILPVIPEGDVRDYIRKVLSA